MDEAIKYNLKISRRSRRVRLIIYPEGKLVVSAPLGTNLRIVENFVIKKMAWIKSKLEYFKNHPVRLVARGTRSEFLEYKKRAFLLAQERLNYFNQIYNFKFTKISIKNQKSRWGSCSRKGNINFNYKIALLPAKLANYIIVHELCHLGAFNHSRKFWELVEKAMPDYKLVRREIRRGGL